MVSIMSRKKPEPESERNHLSDNTAVYEYHGRTLNLREWSRSKMCKCSLTALKQRMTKGWTFSTAMNTPTGNGLVKAKKPGKPGPKAKPEWQKRAEMIQSGVHPEDVEAYARAKIKKKLDAEEKVLNRKKANWATG